LFRQKAADKRT